MGVAAGRLSLMQLKPVRLSLKEKKVILTEHSRNPVVDGQFVDVIQTECFTRKHQACENFGKESLEMRNVKTVEVRDQYTDSRKSLS